MKQLIVITVAFTDEDNPPCTTIQTWVRHAREKHSVICLETGAKRLIMGKTDDPLRALKNVIKRTSSMLVRRFIELPEQE